MFNFFKKPTENKHLLELGDRVREVEAEIKSLKLDVQRIEIKSLEYAKKYQSKLSKIEKSEDKSENSLESSVLVPESQFKH